MAANAGDLGELVPAWQRSLRAENESPKTVETCSEATTLLLRFLRERGLPTVASALTGERVETFIGDLLARFEPATASNRYRALARLSAFLVDEGELTESPMRMKPPTVPEKQVPVTSEGDLRKLRS